MREKYILEANFSHYSQTQEIDNDKCNQCVYK